MPIASHFETPLYFTAPESEKFDFHRRLGVISVSELKFIGLTALFVSFVTTIPYLLGPKFASHNKVFTGVLQHSTDSNNYLAYAREAEKGLWLFHNPMTGEPHGNVFFNLEWLAVGKLANLLQIGLPSSLNILRIVSVGLMCYGIYRFSSFFLTSIFARRTALVAIMCGGGFGWTAALHVLHIRFDSSYFLDLSNANLFPYYWALKLPHFLISETFTVLGLCAFLKAEIHNEKASYFSAGCFYLAAGSCRPYDMLYVMLVTVIYVCVDSIKKHTLHGLLLRTTPAAMCLPLLGYYYWVFTMHPVFRWWSLPGLPAPAPWRLALGFGLTSIGLLLSLYRPSFATLHGTRSLIPCALLAAILLTYLHHFLHFAFQFATNILVPAVVFVLMRWEHSIVALSTRKTWPYGLLICIVFVNSLTPLALTSQTLWLVRKGSFQEDANLIEAYSWVDSHSRPDDLVLADFNNSNELPQYAHNRVFCGYDNAVRFRDKLKALDLFFTAGTSDGFRKDMLNRNSIRLVLLTPGEQNQLRSLIASKVISEAFRNDSVAIYYAADAATARSRFSNSGILTEDLDISTARMNSAPIKR